MTATLTRSESKPISIRRSVSEGIVEVVEVVVVMDERYSDEDVEVNESDMTWCLELTLAPREKVRINASDIYIHNADL